MPAFERLGGWAGEAGLDASDGAGLLEDARCQTLLQEEIFGEIRDLARFETPKKIGLIAEAFTVEDGTLTPHPEGEAPRGDREILGSDRIVLPSRVGSADDFHAVISI